MKLINILIFDKISFSKIILWFITVRDFKRNDDFVTEKIMCSLLMDYTNIKTEYNDCSKIMVVYSQCSFVFSSPRPTTCKKLFCEAEATI